MIDLKQVFLDALSPNTQVRKEAEAALKSFVKRPGFIVDLINFFEDPDPRIQRISSIIFKNFTIAEWAEPEFQSQKEVIMSNIVNLIARANTAIKVDFVNLLVFILDNESIENWSLILKQSIDMLQEQTNASAVNTALTVISCVAKNDKVKYDCEKSEMVIGPIFPYLVGMLRQSSDHGAFETSKILMKMITNLQDPYFTPQYLSDVNLIAEIYKVAAEVINKDDPAQSDLFYNHKKWCVKFFTRILSKHIRNKGGKHLVKEYVLDQQNCIMIYNIIINAIKKEIRNGLEFTREQEGFLSACVAFLNMIVSEKGFNCDFVKADIAFIIFYFIYPFHIFSEEDEYRFESETSEYIKDKYNYYAVDIRGFVCLLFNEIMKRFKKDKPLRESIFIEFMRIMDEYAINPTIENAKRKYGALWLITSSPKFVMIDHDEFINKYIIPDLFSSVDFLCSQACFSLQNLQSKSISDKTINGVFEGVIKNMKSHKDIVRAEAIFAIQFLLDNPSITDRLKSAIPLIIQNILDIQSKTEVEAMNDLLKNITIEFPEEVSSYFPQLVNLFSTTIISNITDLNEDKITLFSSYIDTTVYLLDALDNKPELVYNLYCISADMMYVIFTNQAIDLYPSAIELFSEIVFSLRRIDDSMWNLFTAVMQLPDSHKYDSAIYLVSLIDNFISFGQGRVFEQINPILKFIEIMCKPEDSCFMDEEYQYGCQIIDSLILHHNQEVAEVIPFFVDCLLTFYDEIDRSSTYIVNHLDSLMNCFILNFMMTWSSLSSRNHIGLFFEDLFETRNKFIRVFDKKISILFASILLKSSSPILDVVEVSKFKAFFMRNLETLPDAISKRNLMIERNSNNVEETGEEEVEEDDLFYDLQEDIYFITPIDGVNVFVAIKNSFNELGSFGLKVLNIMNEQEKQLVTQSISNYCQNN